MYHVDTLLNGARLYNTTGCCTVHQAVNIWWVHPGGCLAHLLLYTRLYLVTLFIDNFEYGVHDTSAGWLLKPFKVLEA